MRVAYTVDADGHGTPISLSIRAIPARLCPSNRLANIHFTHGAVAGSGAKRCRRRPHAASAQLGCGPPRWVSISSSVDSNSPPLSVERGQLGCRRYGGIGDGGDEPVDAFVPGDGVFHGPYPHPGRVWWMSPRSKISVRYEPSGSCSIIGRTMSLRTRHNRSAPVRQPLARRLHLTRTWHTNINDRITPKLPVLPLGHTL